MADPENFEEDDLFADLYTEDDVAPKAEPAEIKTEYVEPAAPVAVKEEAVEVQEGQNGNGDEQMYTGDDYEDDIDITTTGGNGNTYDSPSIHEAHGPGIKEDG
ncbi:hypothetical protein LSUE1_G003045 [Lachnellula suecica]|uniref:Uncharacterized protein n=1 Tax=Lachnellula suecica TaxID=602035 RepID=A0A8T9C8X5_9HELO|nr:hypothetical protein LSUE1_G003045 [Lachnellula suecica]